MTNEVEEIKSKLDLVELVGSYVTLKKAGANYKAPCPFHQEKTASLMVSPEKQIWKCFGCGRGGDHYKFVMEAETLEFGDALRLLAQRAGVQLQPRTKTEFQTRDRKETLFAINDLSSRVFYKLLTDNAAGKAALTYLEKRKISLETIKKFRLGFAPRGFNLKNYLLKKDYLSGDIEKAGNPDRFFERIIFPLFDVLGNVVGFTGRTLGSNEPKYLNSPETPVFNKSRVLYGLNFAKAAIKERDYVVLVEGQMDVISLQQAGVTQAVASSGTAITETQIETLSKYTPNFLLAFDNDAAGVTATKKVIEILIRKDLNSKVVSFGKYKDASELFEADPNAWKDAVKKAEEGLEWWLQQEISKAGDIQFIENKKQVIKAILPVLALVSDAPRLDYYAQRLALKVGVKTESITAALQKVRPIRDKNVPAEKPKIQANLTNEEQLLALCLSKPEVIQQRQKLFDEVVWQTEAANRVAGAIKQYYNDQALTKDSIRFLSQVKTSLDPETSGNIVSGPRNFSEPTDSEKIDAWQFWLSTQWDNLTDELATELVDEKLSQVATKQYENKKEDLARSIKRAQEAGDISSVKELMKKLGELTKEK